MTVSPSPTTGAAVAAASIGTPSIGTPSIGTPSIGASAPVAVPSALGAVRGWVEGRLLVLDVPIRSQFDSSEYQATNCGPTSLAMVLEAFGVDVPTASLRRLANLLQGTYDRETGIALDHLAAIARQAGLRAIGPRAADGYRRWSVDEVREEVRRGHPVITLVRMRELPDHAGNPSPTDHYVVVVGLDGDQLLINDPALPGERGFRRPLGRAELERAWAASSIPGQAVAIAAGSGVPELAFTDPAGGAAVTAAPQPEGVRQTESPAVVPGGGQSAPSPLPPIVIVVTPAAPQVFVITLPPMPTPLPTQERWTRSGRVVPPAGTPVAAAPRGDAVVLAESTPPPSVPPLHWPVRAGILLAAGAVLRRLLR